MLLPLILFLLSFLGIIIMISLKLTLVRNGQIAKVQNIHPFENDLEKIKHSTFKNTKKFGYMALFVTLKFFIKSSNFIKIKSKIFAEELKNKFNKNKNGDETTGKKEVSKYLKTISEYREKIRKMKHKIKEEEGIE